MPHLDPGELHALLDGEIPSSELPRFRAHLDGCAECRARMAEEQELFEEADRLVESIELPTEPATAASAPSTRPGMRWATQVAWAATVVLAAGFGYTMRRVTSPEPVVIPAQGVTASAPAVPARVLAPDSFSRRDAAPEPRKETRSANQGQSLASAPAESERRLPASSREKSAPLQDKAAARPFTTPNRLEETIVTAVSPRAAGRVAGLASSSLAQSNLAPAIEYPDAVARLGAPLRQIEGLIPRRLEATGDTVRVVYRIGARQVTLLQRRDAGEVQIWLEAPADFPADSVRLLLALVRD